MNQTQFLKRQLKIRDSAPAHSIEACVLVTYRYRHGAQHSRERLPCRFLEPPRGLHRCDHQDRAGRRSDLPMAGDGTCEGLHVVRGPLELADVMEAGVGVSGRRRRPANGWVKRTS